MPAISFLDRLLKCALDSDSRLPITDRVLCDIFGQGRKHASWTVLTWLDNADFLFDDPETYYREIFSFAESEFGVLVGESEKR